MILSAEVIAISTLNIIFLLFASIAFYLSIKISLKWDIDSTSSTQYTLQKYGFLASTIIKYIFALKIPLLIFFVFTLDKISNVITGAMCAAGVIDATHSGYYLIALKVLNIYLFAYWLRLNSIDVSDEHQPYTKMKFALFSLFFVFLVLEIFLDFYFFGSIDIDKMVSCCGSIYSSSSTSAISLLFDIDNAVIVSVFYANYLLILLFFATKKKYLFALFNMVFVIVALISLILFFSTYIYELPSHNCPFCFLQKDYYYVGYLIYVLLFLGTYEGIVLPLLRDTGSSYRRSVFFNTLYVILLSLYVAVYYIKNGVFL